MHLIPFIWRRSAADGDPQVACPFRGHAVSVENCFACPWGSAAAGGGPGPALACRAGHVSSRPSRSLEELLYERGQI